MRHPRTSPFRPLLLSLALAIPLAACGDRAPAGPQADATPAGAGDNVAAMAEPAAEAPVAGDPMAAQLAALGGGLHALAESCGGYSASELDAMKAQQREQALQGGMSPGDFDAGFARGHADASAKLAGASAAEREKSCAQAEQMRQMGALQAR